MESCPFCSYVGKSLRKHFSKVPKCKQLSQQNQKSKSSAGMPKPFPPNVIEMPQNDFMFSSDDGTSAMMADKETEPDDTQSHESPFEDNASNCSSVVMPKESSYGFTIDQYCETDLAKLLNDKHVPHGLYQDVLEWAHKAKRMKYSFKPKRVKRSALVRHLSR